MRNKFATEEEALFALLADEQLPALDIPHDTPEAPQDTFYVETP
jgi:hypothetical protein